MFTSIGRQFNYTKEKARKKKNKHEDDYLVDVETRVLSTCENKIKGGQKKEQKKKQRKTDRQKKMKNVIIFLVIEKYIFLIKKNKQKKFFCVTKKFVQWNYAIRYSLSIFCKKKKRAIFILFFFVKNFGEIS